MRRQGGEEGSLDHEAGPQEKLREVTNARSKKPVSRMIQLVAPPDADADGEDLEKTSQEEMRTSIKVLFMGLPNV